MRALLVLLALVPIALPPAGAHHPENCATPLDGGDEATVVMEHGIIASPLLFGCVEIPSGGGVTFAIASLGEHVVQSRDDSGQCWRSDRLGASETYRVELRYDHRGLVRLVDGTETDCNDAVHWANSDAQHAYVSFNCRLHPGVAGIVAVRAA